MGFADFDAAMPSPMAGPITKNGAASIVPMRQALAELADPARPRPKLVIWEIVERGFLEGDWGEPGF